MEKNTKFYDVLLTIYIPAIIVAAIVWAGIAMIRRKDTTPMILVAGFLIVCFILEKSDMFEKIEGAMDSHASPAHARHTNSSITLDYEEVKKNSRR